MKSFNFIKTILLFLCFPVTVFSQITENFDDGDFTNNPVWTGDTAQFKINTSKQLQLNSTIADTSYLSTPNTLIDSTEWKFWVKLSFNTSSNNNARVYLVSDQSNLESPLNGYFVQIGPYTGAADNISLYKQTGTTCEQIIAGTIAFTGNSTNTLRIKVTRKSGGNWALYSDPTGNYDFQLEGTATDNTFSTASFFGVFCKYTVSNATKFYFDEFSVGHIIIDTIPPAIDYVLVTDSNKLDIQFTEQVEDSSAQKVNNYFVDNGIGNPITAIKDAENKSLVHLTFSASFGEGLYTITITDVEDLEGNPIDSTTQIIYFAKPYDVVFNEIMADPYPPLELPNYEYVELYNRTPYPINLKNWTYTYDSTTQLFLSITIEPDSFLILTSADGATELSSYGPTISFSSFSLTNAGQTLILRNWFGKIIHTVSYTDDWYQVSTDGGLSLEQIDPLNPCGNISNWKASTSTDGGTPGTLNSVYASNPDITPPEITSISVIDTNTIRIYFNESIDSTTLTNKNNYSIDHGIGNPDSVILISPDYKSVILNLANSIQQDTIYTLTITDTICDCAGNTNVNISKQFALYAVQSYDVVINEIMADPSPVVGLPNYEYLELYNTTKYPIGLKNWTIALGTTKQTFPDIVIDPYEYLILTSDEGKTALNTYGDVIDFTSFSITNSGQSIVLSDALNRIISSVNFNDTWYQDDNKKEGGWSLEQIDPLNPCGAENNWSASVNSNGGTPGTQNSVFASNPDNIAPYLLRIGVINNSTIKAFFSESLDSVTVNNPNIFTIDHGLGHPTSIALVSPDYKSVLLTLPAPMQQDVIYTLSVTNSITDCAGNLIDATITGKFSLPSAPDFNALVINEILFNPKDDGVDFVELYNRSDKTIDLSQLYLTSGDLTTGAITDIAEISAESYLLFPQEYLALTSNPRKVKEQYFTPNPDGFIQMTSFPSYNDDEDIAALSKKDLVIIDKFQYNDDMHFVLLKDVEGVSLERIDFERPTQDATNWHSASETVGFATPAYQNSQYHETSVTDDNISVEPEIFSPDNDGYNDVVNISYRFDEPGYVGNIIIYDSKGRQVKNLVKNSLLGTGGTFSWDGINDENAKARIGIYVIFFEVFNLNGTVQRYKKTCVLATKF